MASVNVYYNSEGHPLTVWFDDPEEEVLAEETGDEVVLMKDKHGRVIGFERIIEAFDEAEGLVVDMMKVPS